MVTTIWIIYRANVFVTEGLVLKTMYMGHMRPSHEPEFSRVLISTVRVKVRELVSAIWPRV